MSTGLRVWLDDVDVTCHAFAPLEVSWGRDHPGDSFEPRRVSVVMDGDAGAQRGQTMRVELNAPATDPQWRDVLTAWSAQVATWSGARVLIVLFRGQITDTDTHWEPIIPHETWAVSVDVLAVDPVAGLANLPVGDVPWPQETVKQRAERIEASTPLAWVNDDSTAQVAARDVDSQPALGLLDELTQTASISGGIWYDPATQLAYFLLDRRNSRVPNLSLDGCQILDEAHLAESVVDVVNDVVVTYVNPADLNAQPEKRATSPDSIAKDGRRYSSLSTTLIDGATAQARADTTVKRFALVSPRWQDVALSSRLEPARAVAEAIMKAQPGLRVRLDDDIPAPAHSPWDGYVEGWSISVDDKDWLVALQLSPASWSGPLLPWSEVTADKTWGDVDPVWRWIDTNDEIRWTSALEVAA